MSQGPKLILHSDQSAALTATRDRDLLHSLTGRKAPRVTYIPSSPDRRRRAFQTVADYYEKIGCSEVIYFDPEETADPAEVSAAFTRDVVHLSGGEVVTFRRRLSSSGCDEKLRDFSRRGGVIVGVSAGAMLLGRTFRTASLFGEKGDFTGLGFFDFELVPHVAEHFPKLDLLQVFARKHQTPLYALNDGDVLVVQGNKIRIHGQGVLIQP
jgi:dipeptidase E